MAVLNYKEFNKVDNAYSFSLKCSEFDEFNELVKDWDVDFKAISSSAEENIHLYQSFSGLTQLSWAKFDLAVDQRALSPAGMRTIAILPPTHPELLWCGKSISDEKILLFNKSGEMESVSKEGFEVFTLSVPETWLEKTNGSEQVIHCSRNIITSLYHKLSTLTQALNTSQRENTGQRSQALQDSTIFESLATVFESPNSHLFSIAKERRIKILSDALHFIHSKCERIFIAEICFYAKVSERTLERLFKDSLGISPKKYLNRFLLQQANHLLKGSSPSEAKVVDIAYKFGFIHIGQFAADYYKIFNELPSVTLNSKA